MGGINIQLQAKIIIMYFWTTKEVSGFRLYSSQPLHVVYPVLSRRGYVIVNRMILFLRIHSSYLHRLTTKKLSGGRNLILSRNASWNNRNWLPILVTNYHSPPHPIQYVSKENSTVHQRISHTQLPCERTTYLSYVSNRRKSVDISPSPT